MGARFGYSPANVHRMACEVRAGRYRAPQIHDQLIQIKGIDGRVRSWACATSAASNRRC